MNTQNTNLKKLNLTPVRLITLLSVLATLLLVISLFFPMIKVAGISFTFREMEEFTDTDGIFAAVVISCAISCLWAAFPKKWAAIVGALYAIYPIILCCGQTMDWISREYVSLQIGSVCMAFLSVAVFVMSIVKLIVLILSKKMASAAIPAPATAGQGTAGQSNAN